MSKSEDSVAATILSDPQDRAQWLTRYLQILDGLTVSVEWHVVGQEVYSQFNNIACSVPPVILLIEVTTADSPSIAVE